MKFNKNILIFFLCFVFFNNENALVSSPYTINQHVKKTITLGGSGTLVMSIMTIVFKAVDYVEPLEEFDSDTNVDFLADTNRMHD